MTASASKPSSLSNLQSGGSCRRLLAIRPWLVQINWAILTVACLACVNPQPVLAQAERVGKVSGTVTELKPGSISIKSDSGETTAYLIQDKTGPPVMIGGRRTDIRGSISAVGEIPIKLIESGMLVRVECKLNGSGRTESDLDSVQLVADQKAATPKVEVTTTPSKRSQFADTTIVGRVASFKNDKLQLEVPKSDWFKRDRLTLKLAKQATLKIDDDSLARVVPGDEVQEANVLKFSGENFINDIKLKLTGPRDAMTKDFADKLQNQFSHLSDEPGEPRLKRSAHFALHTDISDRQAQVLLAKLETMYELVSGYFKARPRHPIECYVVRDLKKWPTDQIPAPGRAKILEPAGVTLSRSSIVKGRIVGTQSIVYSCDDHGIAQHEAVHAFCAQAFGSTGPTWYSEGMAEMGQYWKKGNLAVDISPFVADYLATSKPQKLKEIVKLNQVTGDSWQNYSWRWALCYLLASNPNYSKRFKQLGLNLMKQDTDTRKNPNKPLDSFDNAFGPIADEISFEYDQFIENLGNGYRADLCVWDWKTKAKKLSGSRKVKIKVKAQAGWQATKAILAAGTSYQYEASGKWQFEPTGEVDADGSPGGRGRLVGVIFKDYKLSEPFELGVKGEFNAYSDGQLYVRCQDDWTSLGDNDGVIELQMQQVRNK